MTEDRALYELFNRLTELISVAHADLPEGVKEFKNQVKKNPDTLDYPAEQRRRDRTRTVRFSAAEASLEGFEDQMMLDYVQRPSDTFLAPFYSAWTALRKAAPFIGQLVKHLVKGHAIILYVLAAIIVLTVLVTSTIDLQRIAAAHRGSLKFYVDFVRSLALPQRDETRHRVRKRTRD